MILRRGLGVCLSMGRKNLKLVIVKRFPNVRFRKIVLFRNPCECNMILLERVNPDHVGVLWGRRKKKYNKGSNFTRIGKVYFEMFPVVVGLGVVGWLDMLTGYVYNLLISVGLLSLLFYSVFCVLFYASVIKLSGVNVEAC